MATSYSNAPKANRRRIQSPENFLEALRTLGKSTASEVKTQAAKAVFTDIPESFGFGSSGTLNPNESFSLNQLQEAENQGYHRAESEYSRHLVRMREQEYNRLLQEEAAAKSQIQNIQQEIRSLAKSLGDFAQEVEVATIQVPVNPGLYHKNFYDHLKSVISSLRQKVESSRNWLSSANLRAQKRSYYWTQVGKSGTKYMLSAERYMVTSTG
jgi:hypothetical protein